LVVVGEAINGSQFPVYGVTVIATFHDASGNLVGATEAATFLPQTVPTQKNPFKLQLFNAPANVDNYQLALRWNEISVVSYGRATIITETVSLENGVEITGEIRNDQRSDLQNLVVVATFYDESGDVINVIPGRTSVATLPPNGTTTYSVQARQLRSYTSYLVQVEGTLFH
jgi:hypothetical protein